MQLIPAAKSIKFESESDYKGQFIIEPLFPGYGQTVGNALRRVLLSSVPGAAIISMKIEGADHEFSALDYVKEDVVDIALNIKQVNLGIEGEVDEEEPLVIKISKTGEGPVTAGDFKLPTQVKIANPKQVIATLTDKASKFEMECIVEKGMGYLPTENREGDGLEIGHMAVDAIFTPINSVNVEIEHVRVGEMTNWDKLLLSVETNNSITCEDAFTLAVANLVEQFSALGNKSEDIEEVEVEADDSEEIEPVEANTEEEEKPAEEETEDKPKKRGRPKKEEVEEEVEKTEKVEE
jgi:DNA-directed RNA polymerase subunit alpha